MSVLREIVVFLCGVWSLRLCMAQVPVFSRCPNMKVVTNFEASRYLGRWYEAEKYFTFFQLGGKCVEAYYFHKGDGVVGVHNKQINTYTGKERTIDGEAKLANPDSTDAKLVVRFPSLPVDIPAPYWVVDTDYDSYAVVWSCVDFGILSARNVWLLTRERNPPAEVIKKAYSVMDQNKIDKSYLIRTDQNNCAD